MSYPSTVPHWVGNREYFEAGDVSTLPKHCPHDDKLIGAVPCGTDKLVADVTRRARIALYGDWQRTNVSERAEILLRATKAIEDRREEIASILALETGRTMGIVLNEVTEAVMHGLLWASEGMRYFGFTAESSQKDRTVKVVRMPAGVCAIIFPFNGPFGGLVKKLFPALLCGNTAVVKSHELTPYTSVLLGQILKESGIPSDVVSIVQGDWATGTDVIDNDDVSLISFTGSAETAKRISSIAAKRLVKVSVEAGGKNPFVVCDDADLGAAAQKAVASAFVLSGQVCAAASRFIVFDSVYDEFARLVVEETNKLEDYPPLISSAHMKSVLSHIENALSSDGTNCLVGGGRTKHGDRKDGYYVEPTILEGASPEDSISREEVFGPVASLYRARDFEEALALANASKYGLTAAIHTRNINRAEVFADCCEAGVVRINGPTFGSEPHMLFGGVKDSGNGWREPGPKTLDVYSEWKVVTNDFDRDGV